MKKNILFIFFGLILSSLIHAQGDSVWRRLYMQNGKAQNLSICPDGGYLMTYKHHSNSLQRAFISKTDINGNTLWVKEIITRDENDLRATTIIDNCYQDSSGSYYMSGMTQQLNTRANPNPLLIKLSPSFEKIWAISSQTPNHADQCRDLTLSPNGFIYALYNNVPAFMDSATYSIFKYSKGGEILWRTPIPGIHIDTMYLYPLFERIEATGENGVIACGDGWYGNEQIGYVSVPCYCFIDNSGKLINTWLPEVQDTFFMGSSFNSVIFPDNNIMIGLGESNTSISTSPALYIYDYYGNRIANNISIKQHGYSKALFYDAVPLNNQTLICSAVWWPGYDYPDTLEYLDYSRQSLAVKVDTSGEIQKIKSLVYYPNNPFIYTAKTPDNKFLFLGMDYDEDSLHYLALFKLNSDLEYDSLQTDTNHYDPWCPGGISSGAVEFYSEDFIITTATGELPKKPENKIQIAPNPAKEHINISFEHCPGDKQLNIFNQKGQLMDRIIITESTHKYTLSLGTYPAGTYIVQLYCNNTLVDARQFSIIK